MSKWYSFDLLVYFYMTSRAFSITCLTSLGVNSGAVYLNTISSVLYQLSDYNLQLQLNYQLIVKISSLLTFLVMMYNITNIACGDDRKVGFYNSRNQITSCATHSALMFLLV